MSLVTFRHVLIAIAALAGFHSPILAAAPSAKVAPRVATVAIKGFAFSPQVLTVTPGTKVTWTNVDEDPHTVVSTNKSFHSAALDTDDKFSFTFTKPGDYAYFCSLHPHMTGRVIVRSK